jgi:hypothetical protein
MNTNLDNIALDLYGKIQTRFPNIKMGDENAKVLSKRQDIPNARFFEFEYKDEGLSLGTVAITLDEDDGIIVQLTGDIADKHHEGAFKFIRGLRTFAKDRLINFDVQNLAKDQLDKRDYQFHAKTKEEPDMQQTMQQQQPAPKAPTPKTAPQSSVMESKMYGTARMSYQDLGEAKLIVKHSQPINPEVAAGRTMHIEGIWVENADGERFRYPYKHLNGARALAEHLKHGGNPYDAIGQHITSLSEELAQLRKFKGYVSRNATLGEAMGGITDKISERIESVKKEVFGLQRKAYYEAFAESFEAHTDEMIPEEIMSDFIDRLTIRTFNEDLRQAFPYIFRLVDSADIPVRALSPEDMLGEDEDDKEDTPHSHQAKTTLKHLKKASYSDRADAAKIKPGVAGYRDRIAMLKRAEEEDNLNELRSEEKDEKGNVVSWKDEGEWKKVTGKEGRGKVTNLSDKARRETEKLAKKDESLDPENRFESFMDQLMQEDDEEQMGDNALFSPNKSTQQAAIDKFNEIMKTELKGGPNGINILDSLKGIIDDPEFLDNIKDIDPDLDARGAIQQELNAMAKENPEIARILPNLDFKGDGSKIGGEEVPPAALPMPTEAPPMAPPAPDASMPSAAPSPDASMPPAPPMAESQAGTLSPLSKAKLTAKLIKARESGAQLHDKMDFGHKEMTLHDCMEACGIDPMECGFGDDEESAPEQQSDPVHDMLKTISGFWNKEEKNFTIGGTRAKVKIIKDFKNGQFKDATPEDVKRVLTLIDRMDPSSEHNQEISHIKHLSGVHGVHPQQVEIEVGENTPTIYESTELSAILKIAGVKK